MTTYEIDLTPPMNVYKKTLALIVERTENDEDRQWCIAELNRLNDACEA
tara:strand:+ start:39 stop:185 length:147 start_codon:yes stop_codon:yes gene_type:complete